MWYPAKVVTPAAAEPISLVEAKGQLNVDFADDDTKIGGMIAAARDFVEKYCNIRLARQTVEMKCDGFTDLARLPVAPVQSIVSIAYVDATGALQTLAETVYELRADDLEASVVLKYGQIWPSIQLGSRISITADVGYDEPPPSVKQAMLLHIADSYLQRESTKVEDWTALDSLLCNYRRGA